jgi:GH25 family lysozyme M1 (1,4-beta-N-acetylmuramidase)
MNAAGNHSMGSTIPEFDPAFPAKAQSKTSRLSAMAASSLIPPGVPGLDVSGWQVLNAANWRQIAADGAKFVYVKATEGTDYTSSQFSEQYNDSYAAGLIRGAYHFATPDTSSGAAQANYLVDHGGNWSGDGRTLPPLLDIEYNPYGQTCYGLNPGQMVSWITDFSNTVKARTGRLPAIYSTTNWWNLCTGSSSAFGANPLFIASWPSNVANGPGTLPPGWSTYAIWQFTDATYSNGQPGLFPGDQDVFNGTLDELQTFARSDIGSTSLVRSVGDSTVFLLSGSSKYPIPSLELMGAFSVLGPVGYVSDQFLAGYVTQQNASRVLRSPGGTIFFTDAGIKLPFGSCGLVVDYGGKCDTSGYVQLTDEQLSHFATGPAMGPILGTTAGARYYVTAGTKREILDNQSQSAAGLPGGFNVLTEAAVSSLPFGPPVVRDAVFAVQRGSSSYSYLGNNARYPVQAGAVSSSGVAGRVAGSLYAQSLALIPAGSSSFTGIVQASGSSTKSVLADGGRYDWAGASTAALPTVSVPQAFINSYPSKGSIAPGAMIKTTSSATVYIVMDSKILPVGAWESLVALAGGKTPVIVTVPDQLVSVLPKGAVALTSNTLVRSPDEATVYLVNGVTNKIAMSNFAYANEAGITGYSYTTQARLDAYPRAKDLLGMGLTCGSTNYVSAAGSVHPVSAALLPQFPFTYVPLDKFTCALLTVGAPATPFIRTPDGTIYYLNGGQKHPIGSMTRYEQLSNGQPWLNVVPLFANPIPTGPTA